MAELKEKPVSTLERPDVEKSLWARSIGWIQERLMAKDPIGRERQMVDQTTKTALLSYEELLKEGRVPLLSPAESLNRSKSLLERIDSVKSEAANRKRSPTPK